MTAPFYDLFDRPPRAPAGEVAVPTGNAGDLTSYLATVCEGVATAVNGTRNDTLNRAGYTLGRIVAAGQLDYNTVADALTYAAHRAGLEDDEIGPTMRSGLQAGEKEPRALDARRTSTWPDLTTMTARSASSADAASASAAAAGGTSVTDTPSEPDRTSWWPRPIGTVIADRNDEPDPTHLARNDGHRLFYSGRVNGLLGESESGKTWVALHAVAQSLAIDEHALYLDFEDSAKGIDGRLRLLGVTEDQLERLHYANPDEALGLAQHVDLTEALDTSPYGLVILDGVNAAMTVLGLDVDSSNKDATVFTQRLLRPLANTGAAVVTIDHVPKNKDQRGKGGIGAQAKRAMTRGCALAVEVVRPFGPGMHGELKLTVDKDTPGKVRGVSASAKYAGIVHLDSSSTGVVMKVEAPDLRSPDERGPFRPTHLMEKVSRWLETIPSGASQTTVENGVGGNRDNVRHALNVLVNEGHVVRSEGARKAVIHTLINPFREL